MEQRQVWQDSVKGIGIILVVFGHVVIGLEGARIISDSPSVATTLYAIYLFHMPLFFVLSGINAERSRNRGGVGFARDKFWGVVYPYFLWSLVQGAIQIQLGGSLNFAISVDMLWQIGWAPFAQFWFLYALAFCHLVMLAWPFNTRWLLVAGVCGVLFSPSAAFPLDKCLFSFFFYACGVVFSGRLLAATANWRKLAALCCAFALAGTANALLNGLKFEQAMALPAAVAGIGVVIIFAKLLRGKPAAFLAALGAMSMSVYILHIMAASGARVIMLKIGVPPQAIVYLLVGTLAGLALPVLAHVLLARLGLLTALGLAAPRRVIKPLTGAVQSPVSPASGGGHR